MQASIGSVVTRALTVIALLCGAVGATVSSGNAAPDPNLCSWRFMSNNTVLNVAFPDSNATYWVLPYALGPDASIELSGTFPAARYMSLNTYGTNFDTVDTLRDNEIVPDPGSANPFVEASAAGLPPDQRRWHATVVAGPADHSRNEIQAVPAGQSTPLGFLIVRIYVPTDAASRSGGVPLPTVTVKARGNTVVDQPCDAVFDPNDYGGPLADVGKAAFNQVIGQAASASFPGNVPEATFVNPASTAGLFPNGDNKYIGAGLTYQPGRLVVVRGKAPTYPNTRAGQSPTASTDVRYWSMCQNDQVTPYPVVACAADFQTNLDGAGYYTYVVAAPGDVPANLGAADTLLPWGATDVRKVLFMRHMLPSPSFYPNSVQASQNSGAAPAASMGVYYPTATYCDKATFERGGAQACFG